MCPKEPPRAPRRAAIALSALTAWATAAEPFTDVAAAVGLDFVHDNGMVGETWLVEIMGAGVGLLDFDGDGRLDLWLVQGGPLVGRSEAPPAHLPCDRLFRNVTKDGEIAFVDATASSGLCASRYGMGIATGDIDNDGDLDVFLANFGPNQLIENLGDGRFRDITPSATFAGNRWSVSASFADFDGDGLSDLYVANYVEFSLADHEPCRGDGGEPSYCSPEIYPPARDRLFRNLGDGGFTDVGDASGIDQSGAALGVVTEDFDADGDLDIYVANDMTDNLLWINDGRGRFENTALLAGVAVNGDGNVEASMGVDAEDFDGDCDVDLFMTHLAVQTNTLYVNDGTGWFTDRSNATGIAPASTPFTGFGGGWFDADNDGDFDVFSANGAVTAIPGQSPGPLDLPLRQRNQLWLNDGSGRYAEIPGGAAMRPEEVSRGTAFGDLDNDGDTDILVTNNRGGPRLYRNDVGGTHWIGITLANSPGKPANGGLVWLDDAPCPRRRVATDGSYASANDERILFGLGGESRQRHVHVRWPDGVRERFGPLTTGRYHTLQRQSQSRRPGGDVP